MSVEAQSPPAAPLGRSNHLEPVRGKTALALLYDEGSGSTYDVRLRLTKETLTVQRQDVVSVGDVHAGSRHRTVTLRRQPMGGLGLSIKGGAEHNVPVVISKIFKDQAADRSGLLFVGDAVLQVNGIHVEHATHAGVVHLLRNAGDEVTITVEYLSGLASFLKLPTGCPWPSSSPCSRAYSPLFDSALHLNGCGSHTVLSLPSSPTADGLKYEKRWLDTLSIPLSMARISRCEAGSRSLRSKAFKVLAVDGACSGVLQFPTAQDCGDWLRAVSANIGHLTLQRMRTVNKGCCPGNQVVHVGWVNERLRGTDAPQTFGAKFLVLRGSSVYVFHSPPVSTADWEQAESIYDLCEVLFKVHKFWVMDDCWLQANHGLRMQDLDLEDQRLYCFSLLAGQGRSHFFTVELGTELAMWEKAFQRAMFLEVQRTGSRTYVCGWQGVELSFTVDFRLGFICFDSKTKNVLWRFKFSQLKGSSDDGNTRVRLLFQNPDTKQIEVKELEFQDLLAVLHCVHSFMASKVASLDPAFPDSHSLSRRLVHSRDGSSAEG